MKNLKDITLNSLFWSASIKKILESKKKKQMRESTP